MFMQSYNYAHRKGIEELSWSEFGALSRELAERLARQKVDVVIGVARAGLFPAAAVAAMLRVELLPVRVTRRVGDVVNYKVPVWRVDVPDLISRLSVAVVDEIADSGQTLSLVSARVYERGARQVCTVSLFAHSWADPMPDLTARVSDSLVIFPWDQEVLSDGKWGLHPEIEAAILAQRK
jgi:hypoxanthine phosphoribosyltransferase